MSAEQFSLKKEEDRKKIQVGLETLYYVFFFTCQVTFPNSNPQAAVPRKVTVALGNTAWPV